MATTHVVELQAAELPGADGGRGADRAGGGDASAIELDVPQPSRGFEQAVLSVDERGVTTWSFAPPAERGPSVRGDGATRTFTIRRTPGAPAGARSNVGPVDLRRGRQARAQGNRVPRRPGPRQSREQLPRPVGNLAPGLRRPRLRDRQLHRARGVLRRRHRALAGACQGPDAAVRPRHVQPGARRVQRPAARGDEEDPGDVRGPGHRVRPPVDQPRSRSRTSTGCSTRSPTG